MNIAFNIVKTKYIQSLYKDNKQFYDMMKSQNTSKNRRNNAFLKHLYTKGIYYKALIDKDKDKSIEYYDIVKDTIYEIMEVGVKDEFNVFCINMVLIKTNFKKVFKTNRFIEASEFIIEENEGGYLRLCDFMKEVFEGFKNLHNDYKEGQF